MKAAIGYLRRPIGPTKFGRSCLALCMEDWFRRRIFENRWFDLCWPPYPNTGRNELWRQMQRACAPDVDVFVWLDDDMAFEPHEVYAILESIDPVTRPVVSALYFARGEAERDRARPVILRRDQRGIMRASWDYAPGGLVEVDAVGLGLCAVHRSLIDRWQREHGDTWFDYRGTGLHGVGGFTLEDSAWSARVQEMGGRLWVHTGIRPRHLKTVEIGETQYLAETIALGPGGMKKGVRR